MNNEQFRLENDRLIFTARSRAGEMTSLYDKKKNRELLYQGDQGWSGRNPSLFPVIGKTWQGGSYTVNGKNYTMKNHGLVRYADLEGSQDRDHIRFVLNSDEETKAQYPYDFSFVLDYFLMENGVKVHYTITNTGEQAMPFSFGLHPAFKTSQNEQEKFEDFSVRFSPVNPAEQIEFFADLSPVHRIPTQLKEWKASREDLEKFGTLVFDQIQADTAVLYWKEEPRLKMVFPDFPSVALWSSEKKSDFICIEPWYGHTDFEKVDVPFEKREGTMILEPGQIFESEYTLEVL